MSTAVKFIDVAQVLDVTKKTKRNLRRRKKVGEEVRLVSLIQYCDTTIGLCRLVIAGDRRHKRSKQTYDVLIKTLNATRAKLRAEKRRVKKIVRAVLYIDTGISGL